MGAAQSGPDSGPDSVSMSAIHFEGYRLSRFWRAQMNFSVSFRQNKFQFHRSLFFVSSGRRLISARWPPSHFCHKIQIQAHTIAFTNHDDASAPARLRARLCDPSAVLPRLPLPPLLPPRRSPPPPRLPNPPRTSPHLCPPSCPPPCPPPHPRPPLQQSASPSSALRPVIPLPYPSPPAHSPARRTPMNTVHHTILYGRLVWVHGCAPLTCASARLSSHSYATLPQTRCGGC